ncbi:ABC transporter ATP-binding protein [Nocardiopsis halotolerans]|uniref:ABC transporter ATP-binding protein n=1 Tax=Nocardiopsis halotolerans TaxID=124252 RepID=UPI0003486BCB|nr:ABC transporter ATP-binding protein [Nocardiopsis halotolerans]
MTTLDTRPPTPHEAMPLPENPASAPDALRVDSVTKTFTGGVRALDDVGLAARPGQVVGLLGHNGAGKTTLVRLVSGLLTPTSGTVSVLGFDPVRDGVEVRRRIGVLPSSQLLDNRLSGRENLRFAGRLFGVDPARLDERVDSLLDEFGMLARADDRVSTYSAGMRQRTALARVLLSRPELLLLDEPSSALDPVAIRELHELIRRKSREERIAVVICTHDLAEAADLCDEVLILSQGRVIASGSPQELAARVDVPTAVELECEAADTDAALAVMAGFTDAERVSEGTFRLDGVARSSVPELVGSLVGAGVRLYTVRTAQATLEDLYLRLHAGDDHGDRTDRNSEAK